MHSEVGIRSANDYQTPGQETLELLSMSSIAPEAMQYVVEKPICIEDYAFLGVHSVVLPGVHIGKGAVIGAGSVVLSDIPPFSIAVGAPARVIKERPHPPELEAQPT